MLRKLKALATALVCASCAPAVQKPPHTSERWAAYYDKELPASVFRDYDLVVFDRLYHPNFSELQPRTTVLAYLSVGEVHGDTDEQALLAQQQALVGQRTKWNSYTVDITHPTWTRILDDHVEDALAKGFDGVMLDTLDSALHLSDMESAEKSEAAEKAAVKLIVRMRERHPQMKIMLNRGFEILPKVAKVIDFALGESILTEPDVSTGQYRTLPPQTYQTTASKLLNARAIAPRLQLYTLDYWNQDDVQGLQTIYAIHRARGFSPYVSTQDLRRHTPEPVGTFQPPPPSSTQRGS